MFIMDVLNTNINLNNEGKLIATNGILDIGGNYLEDNNFGVKVNTPVLRRVVEVYQWVETTHEDENGNVTYTYNKEWNSSVINSKEFNESSTHVNPNEFLYQSDMKVMDFAKIGDFTINSEILSSLETNFEFDDYDPNNLPTNFKIDGKYITNSSNITVPQIGDVRIAFEYSHYTNVSVLGKQYNNTIVSYETKQGTKINHIVEGTYNGSQMIDSIESSNNTLKWILRAAGTISVVIGFVALFNPLATLTSFIPAFGGLVGGLISLVAMLIGIAVSLMVIAVSWIIFRPLLGLGLLAGAIALIVGAVLLVKSKKKNQQLQSVQPVMNNNYNNFQ